MIIDICIISVSYTHVSGSRIIYIYAPYICASYIRASYTHVPRSRIIDFFIMDMT